MVSKNLKELNLQVQYDDSADVLYVSFGDPRPGIAVEVRDGDLVRIDPFTDELLGITFLDFKERYIPRPPINFEKLAQKIIPEILDEFKK